MNKLQQVYTILFKSFGPQGWWPITSLAGMSGFDARGYHKGHYEHPQTNSHAFEVFIGAILTQNTSWVNVEKAMAELRKHSLLDCRIMSCVKSSFLAGCIRSSGYFNQKAERLKQISLYISEIYEGDVLRLFDKPASKLREELLSLNGIGPETADSIILYAAKKQVFVVDAYTKRIFSRLGLCNNDVSYEELQKMFYTAFSKDFKLFNEYHALIVELAKRHCTKNAPACEYCPINKICKKLV